VGASPVYSPEFIQRVLVDIKERGPREAARIHHLSHSTTSKWGRGLGQAAITVPPTPQVGETLEQDIGPSDWTINLRSATIHTYEQLVDYCKVDLNIWEPERFKVKSYQMSYKPPATREGAEKQWTRMHHRDDAETITMYSVTASFKKRLVVIAAKDMLAEVIAEAASRVSRSPLVLVRPPRTGYMLGISIADAHNGKLCWGMETGGPDYDLKLAVAAQEQAFETLLARSSHLAFERVLLIVGNDGLHVDSNANTTTKGTPQDVDGRSFKTFGVTWRTYVDQIERARRLAPVQVVVMPGNHDTLSMLHIGEVLTAWFRNDPDVTVDNLPKPRKYVTFGRNLIGIQHGDSGKPQQWASQMPLEAETIWAGRPHRHILTGHLHTERMEQDEVNGVKVWRVPSLAPADYWHSKNGYIGNKQSALAFHFHAEDGLIGTAAYTHQSS
jgi:hypothetical protein